MSINISDLLREIREAFVLTREGKPNPTGRRLSDVIADINAALEDAEREKVHAMKPRPLGRFFVARQFIDEPDEVTRALMARVIVVRCEYHWDRVGFEYTALNEEDFELIAPGTRVPEYQIVISKNPDFKIDFRKEK